VNLVPAIFQKHDLCWLAQTTPINSAMKLGYYSVAWLILQLILTRTNVIGMRRNDAVYCFLSFEVNRRLVAVMKSKQAVFRDLVIKN